MGQNAGAKVMSLFEKSKYLSEIKIEVMLKLDSDRELKRLYFIAL